MAEDDDEVVRPSTIAQQIRRSRNLCELRWRCVRLPSDAIEPLRAAHGLPDALRPSKRQPLRDFPIHFVKERRDLDRSTRRETTRRFDRATEIARHQKIRTRRTLDERGGWMTVVRDAGDVGVVAPALKSRGVDETTAMLVRGMSVANENEM